MAERKPIPLLDKDMLSIIKTNYGLKKIPPCFGHLDIKNPYEIESDKYLTPDQMQEVRRKYTYHVRSALAQAEMCTTCHLFEKCVVITDVLINKRNRVSYTKMLSIESEVE